MTGHFITLNKYRRQEKNAYALKFKKVQSNESKGLGGGARGLGVGAFERE